MKLNKRVWESPVVGVQVFAPQEYCASCWHVEASNVYTRNTFLSIATYGLFRDGDKDGRFDMGEEVVTNTDRPRLPASDSFVNVPYPNNLAVATDYYSTWIFLGGYSNKQSKVYNYDRYYFSEYEEDGNHS